MAQETPGTERAREKTVLRGATLISAPFTLVGIIAASLAVFGLIWTASSDTDASSGWPFTAIAAAVALAAFLAARGCKVVIADGEVRDVVAWRTVRVTPKQSIRAIRVRRGPWRTFEMETTSSERFVVLGAGPVQFPAHLLPDAAERDLSAIDAMGGELRS